MGVVKYKHDNIRASLLRRAVCAEFGWRCDRESAGLGLTMAFQAWVTFDLFEFFAEFLACHLQGTLESPALPSVVQCAVCQQRQCDVSDELYGIRSKCCELAGEV